MQEIQKYLNTVHCMDCLEFMRSLPDKCIDLVLTDPPYGIKADKGFIGAGGFGGKGLPIPRRAYTDDRDKYTPGEETFNEMLRVSKNAIVFGGNYFTDKLPQSNHWIYRDKLNTMPTFSDGELVWTNIKRNSVKKDNYRI